MANIQVYGAYWCPDCRRSKQFLSEYQIDYDWIDIEQNEDGRAYVEKINAGKRIIPTIVFDDGSFLVEPSNAQLAEKLGLATEDAHACHDVTIVGAGPAGLTAAIYLARDGFSVMVVDEGALGGQAATTEALENYPGFPDGIGGAEWSKRVVQQAQKFGVEFLQAQRVEEIYRLHNTLWIKTNAGQEYGSDAILIATGADYRRMGVEGEDDFIGAGVHFCSTCDGPFYRDKEVVIVGGGYSAAEESMALLRFVNHITMLVRGDQIKASKTIVEKIDHHERINVHYNTAVTKLAGDDGKVSRVHTKNKESGAEGTVETDGVFVFIGQQPNTGFLKDVGIALDEQGYIITGHALLNRGLWSGETPPTVLETSMPGVFAAGDARLGSTKQVASASGEGATAALLMREYLYGNG